MIYLDNAATTRVDEDVLKTYNEISLNNYANPASPHIFSKETESLLEKARKAILTSLHLSPYEFEVIFTSGATEANNLGIIGYALRQSKIGKHIIVSKVEHSSVVKTVRYLRDNHGFEMSWLPVLENGQANLEELEKMIRDDTTLVCIMAANNETGSVNDISKISEIIKRHKNAKFFCDSTQALGKIDLPYSKADFISLSGHKIHALKGVGFLIKRKDLELETQSHGGPQEGGNRSGTSNVAGCYCLAKALQIATKTMQNHTISVQKLWDKVDEYIQSKPDLFVPNSYKGNSPYVYNFSFKKHKASVVVEALSMRGIMVSSVSACNSKREPISWVVQAMGREDKLAKNTMRVSFSKYTTLDDVETFIKTLDEILPEIKENE